MSKITINSTRVYYKDLNISEAKCIKDDIKLYQSIKNTVYKRLFENKHYHMHHVLTSTVIKKDFNTNDYMPLSAISEAKGIYKSSDTWNTKRRHNLENRISKTVNKINKEKALLNAYLNTKQSLINCFKGLTDTVIPIEGFRQMKDYCIYNNQYMSLYLFEVRYLNPMIKMLRNRIRLLEYRKDRLEEKLLKPDSMIFFKRRNYMKITGRSQGKYCNNLFKYDYITNTMNYISSAKERISFILDFPYRKEELIRVLDLPHSSSGKAVCYTLTDYGDYFIIKATIELNINRSLSVSSADSGAVGIDINRYHISLCETNDIGNLLYTKDYLMPLKHKSSSQRKWIIENTVKEIVSYCKTVGKPLVIENLNFNKTKEHLKIYNQNRMYNLMISSFAYRQIKDKLYNRALKDLIDIKEVEPAYTSKIAKDKYTDIKGLSVHKCAAYVIARRGQGFKEYKEKRTVMTYHNCSLEALAF